jgi:hypothetical protein
LVLQAARGAAQISARKIELQTLKKKTLREKFERNVIVITQVHTSLDELLQNYT